MKGEKREEGARQVSAPPAIVHDGQWEQGRTRGTWSALLAREARSHTRGGRQRGRISPRPSASVSQRQREARAQGRTVVLRQSIKVSAAVLHAEFDRRSPEAAQQASIAWNWTAHIGMASTKW